MRFPDWQAGDPRFSDGASEGVGATLLSAIQCFARQAELSFQDSEEALRFAQAAEHLANALKAVR